jgi:hypothetical protein
MAIAALLGVGTSSAEEPPDSAICANIDKAVKHSGKTLKTCTKTRCIPQDQEFACVGRIETTDGTVATLERRLKKSGQGWVMLPLPVEMSVGPYSVKIPSDWPLLNAKDAGELRRQLEAQGLQIHPSQTGKTDPAPFVALSTFTIESAGSIAFVVLAVSNASGLGPALAQQAIDRLELGLRAGHVRSYKEPMHVVVAGFAGALTKAITKSGGLALTARLHHDDRKDVLLQVTLLAPPAWPESKASFEFFRVLATLRPAKT